MKYFTILALSFSLGAFANMSTQPETGVVPSADPTLRQEQQLNTDVIDHEKELNNDMLEQQKLEQQRMEQINRDENKLNDSIEKEEDGEFYKDQKVEGIDEGQNSETVTD